MNRHERRAAEAEARRAFEKYRALCQRAYKKSDDRTIGESWMRGETAAASGIDAMFIHPVGEKPPPVSDSDILLSARYGPQEFKARTTSANFPIMVADWSRFREEIGWLDNSPVTDDERHDAREFIFQTILENRWQSDPQVAAVTAGAIAWLASTSPAGLIADASYTHIHYEVTDYPVDVSGRKFRNFRLMLGKGAIS